MEMRSVSVEDLIARIQRELPDTDRDRYDIAYARGRAQARSATFFGGLALGGLLGGALVFFLDPDHGEARRDALRHEATARWREVSKMAGERSREVRERLTGETGDGSLDLLSVGEERVVVPVGARSTEPRPVSTGSDGGRGPASTLEEPATAGRR